MTRSVGAVGEPAGRQRVDWWSKPSLRLHAVMVFGVAVALGGGYLELTRAREGHAIAWAYTFEWPLFAVMGIYLWWRLLHGDDHAAARSNRPRRADVAIDDPDLQAWQAYLSRLEQADPPGGPPQRP